MIYAKLRLPACLIFLAVFMFSPCGAQNHKSSEDISVLSKAVVMINVVVQYPDYVIPWNPGSVISHNGTGFLISGNRILTNAHVASNARFITVEKEGDSRKYEAKVKFVAHDCDLAMLEVADKSFFEGMVSLEIGEVPKLDSTVIALGYPIGGDRMSVTRGVVSRIDFRTYSHSSADSHLAIQIDAAINPGNSGGPVLQNNTVVGVAFQGLRGDAQSVGYMIPSPVVKRFLKDVDDGRYDRYVDLGLYFFPLLNNSHRRALGLENGDYGVMASHVITAGASSGIIEVGDVLLSIDGHPIFSNGYVELEGEWVNMAEIVERKFKGDSVNLKILRDRKEMSVDISPNTPWPYMMQARRYGVRPRYVLFGGLVFQPLTSDFLKSRKSKDVNLLYHFSSYFEKELYLERPEIIVISKILTDPINAYLDKNVNSIVDSINGRKIETLEDISAAFADPADYYVIRLLNRGCPIVFESKAVEAARERIMRVYRVPGEEYLGDPIVPSDWRSIKKES